MLLSNGKLVFSETELNCLTWLGISGEVTLSSFCDEMKNKGVYKHPQSVRNFISELLTKENPIVIKNKKMISLNMSDVYCNGSLVLSIKAGYKENA